MQERRRTRVQHQQQKRRKQMQLLVLIIAVLLLLCAAALFRSGQQPDQQPPDAASVSDLAEGNNGGAEGNQGQEKVIPTVSEEDNWKTVLVNSTHAMVDGYVPELVTVDNTNFQFDARAAADLNAMLQAARDEGLSPMICSSYRSWERQTALFEKQVEKQQNAGLSYEEAYEKAKTVVAYPGTSEHQTGLAADIVATSHQLLDDSQADTAEQQWLMANCWKYGFVLRYPLGKSEYTSIIYEPWHYRYVGQEVAQYLTENGLCLEEYWQQLEAQQVE